MVGAALCEHVLHGAGGLVGGGDEGRGWTQPPFHPPVQGAQGAVSTQDGLGGPAAGVVEHQVTAREDTNQRLGGSELVTAVLK